MRKEVGKMAIPWNALRERRALVIVAGTVLAVGLGTSALIWGPGLVTHDQAAQATKTTNSTNQADVSAKSRPAGFSEFRSDQGGFELAYPAGWTKLSPKDPQVLLLATQGTQDSFLVRASQLQDPIGVAQLPAAKQITDSIVTSNKTVHMLSDPKQVNLGGLPGYFYLYSFTDPSTQQEGVHSHFFLFNGKTMISMVFQSLPREHFSESAKTFDQIAASFHALNK
ncbi:MAG: PsbP-related protein [Pseudonocardiaceae bacterium]